ncbi:MAG TPA: ATP-binding cassette domain-containing protein [Gaiellaceae bacterium]|nr:ATP-binding cassette domain-containing protein [Gaiellaceae bacterium]
MTEAVLEARRVSKTYRGRVEALQDVSIAVRRGETLGVVGESGSGKSTLARLLLALDQPTSGEVLFDGEVVSGRRERDLGGLRRSVQVVFQDPMGSLDPRMRVRTAISEPLRALSVPGDHRARVRELLEAVGLPASAGDRYPHEFSGGQRQRIAIARALAPHPTVLIADEAVSALDVSVRAQVLNLLNRLISEFGLTLVFISHDMSVIRYMCSRVAVLFRGRLVEEGATDQVYERPSDDYTRALLAAVPHVGKPIEAVAAR